MIALTITAALLFTTAPLAAQPLRTTPGTSLRLSWDAVWAWARLELGLTGKTPNNKSGCGIDPNGGTCKSDLSTAPDSSSDAGLGIDPNG